MKLSLLNWKYLAVAAGVLMAAGCESPQRSRIVEVPVSVVLDGSSVAAITPSAISDDLCGDRALPEYMRFRFTDIPGAALIESTSSRDGDGLAETLSNWVGFLSPRSLDPDRELVYLNPFVDPLPWEGDADVLGAPLEAGTGGISGIFLLPQTRVRIEFTAWVRPRLNPESSEPEYSKIPELCEGEATVDITGDGQVVTLEAFRSTTANLSTYVDAYYQYDSFQKNYSHISLVDQDTGYGFPVRNASEDDESTPTYNSTFTFEEVPLDRTYRFVAWYPGRHPGNFGFYSLPYDAGKYGVSSDYEHLEDNTEGSPLVAEIDFSQDQPMTPYFQSVDGTLVDFAVGVSADPTNVSGKVPDMAGALDYVKSVNICHLTGGFNSGFGIDPDLDCVTDEPVSETLPPAPLMAFIGKIFGYDDDDGFSVTPNGNISNTTVSFGGATFVTTIGTVHVPAPDPDRSGGRGLETNVIQPDFGFGLSRSYCVWADFFSNGLDEDGGIRITTANDSQIDAASGITPLRALGGSEVANGVCQNGGRGSRPDLSKGVSFLSERAPGPTSASGEIGYGFLGSLTVTAQGPGQVVLVEAPTVAGGRPDFGSGYIADAPISGGVAEFSDIDFCQLYVSLSENQKVRAYTVGTNMLPSSSFVEITPVGTYESSCL